MTLGEAIEKTWKEAHCQCKIHCEGTVCAGCEYYVDKLTLAKALEIIDANAPGLFNLALEEPKKQPEASDSVNHPSHYEVNGYQCIEVMKAVFGEEAVKNYCLCNAFKYIWRFRRKNGDEDIKKAKKYLEFYLEMTEGKKIIKGNT